MALISVTLISSRIQNDARNFFIDLEYGDVQRTVSCMILSAR